MRPPRNKTSSYCKICHNEYQKKYYKLHPRSIDESAQRNKVLLRTLIQRAKEKPCVDCGELYPFYVMDFDHIKGVKKFNLSNATTRYRSIKIVQEEIDKCEVVCSNCHRKRTHKRYFGVV